VINVSIVKVENLCKNFKDFKAVDGISFEIAKGEIFGLIGPNGAGKTTTLRILSTLIRKSSGKVSILDFNVSKKPEEVRKVISYLPEDAGLYKNLGGREYLEFISEFYKGKEKKEDIVKRGVKISNLGDKLKNKVSTYSKGMKRRLLVARALMIKPKLAILDEPTSGLDVVNAHDVRTIIKESVKEGNTVLLSSHNMLEVEYLCDRIALINDGKFVEMGTPSELKEKYKVKNIDEIFMKIINLKNNSI
jgi:ABC-2 type transport system ATP-binding protein